MTFLIRPADWCWPGHTPAQEAKCPGVGNWDMSAPVSAMITSAVVVEMPGMVQIRSRLAWNGAITFSIRSVNASIRVVCSVMKSRCNSTRNAWWSVNRPCNAWVNTGILRRSCFTDISANLAGSRSPFTSACSINRDETPLMSETTTDSLMPASSRTFSKR